VPVVTKFKLFKKRKAAVVATNNTQENNVQEAPPTNRPDISHIVLAGRAYSRDEEKQILNTFGRHSSTDYRVNPSFVPFESKEDVQDADRRVADLLKEIFSLHLPKV